MQLANRLFACESLIMDWIMSDPASGQAGLVAAGFMAAVFAGLACLEMAMPFREARFGKARRWLTNLALFVIDTVLVRLAIPLLMVGTALLAEERGLGLLNWLDWPRWAEVIAAFALLDLAIYVQHRMMHRVPLLWRLHKVHHADPDFDVTTAARFHPAEIMLSMLYKMACVALIGPAALAVFVFEALFNAATLFTHSNLGLPKSLDRMVRKLLVTPDMHRIHHSALRGETDSNYGTLLSLWDRLFRSYTSEAKAGRHGIAIGMPDYQDARPAGLGFSLLLPFKNETKAAPQSAADGHGPAQSSAVEIGSD